MWFRGSDSLTSLPRLPGEVRGRKALALAIRTREAGLFMEGGTIILIQYVGVIRALEWVELDKFLVDATNLSFESK